MLQAAGALCIAAQVDGLRADLVLLRAARAWAAWLGDADVAPAHVQAVAELVLVHRRKPGAPQPQQQSLEQAPSNPPPQSPPQGRPSADSPANGESDSQPSEADWGAMPPEPVGLLRVAVPSLLAREAAKAGAPATKKA